MWGEFICVFVILNWYCVYCCFVMVVLRWYCVFCCFVMVFFFCIFFVFIFLCCWVLFILCFVVFFGLVVWWVWDCSFLLFLNVVFFIIVVLVEFGGKWLFGFEVDLGLFGIFWDLVWLFWKILSFMSLWLLLGWCFKFF